MVQTTGRSFGHVVISYDDDGKLEIINIFQSACRCLGHVTSITFKHYIRMPSVAREAHCNSTCIAWKYLIQIYNATYVKYITYYIVRDKVDDYVT